MTVSAQLTPGVFQPIFDRLAAELEARATSALLGVGLSAESQARSNASQGSHEYGTRTPASPGSGPAIISGTLVSSIAHTEPIPAGAEISMQVGLAGGRSPYYSARTPSSKYGYYLEVSGAGRSHVRYPFLLPACDHLYGAAYGLASAAFGGFGA